MVTVTGTGGISVASRIAVAESTGEHETTLAETPILGENEPELIDRAVDGDTDAFATLYERYVDRVYRHAFYYMQTRTDAEDVAQQTFLRAWQAIGRYRRTNAPILAWFLTIAGRTAISQLRRNRELPGGLNHQDEAAGDDPQDLVVRADSCDHAREAVLQLSPDRQQVIVLRYIEGLSIAEVAAAMGKTENNVSVVQHRALKDLKRRLTATQAEREPRSRVVQTLRDVLVRASGSA